MNGKRKELTPIQLKIRAELILYASKQGLSLQEIADIFKISKGRIDQIIKKGGGKNETS